jgi:hypothetical protein
LRHCRLFILWCGCGLASACSPTLPRVAERDIDPPRLPSYGAPAQIAFQDGSSALPPMQVQKPKLVTQPAGTPLGATETVRASAGMDVDNLVAMAEYPQPTLLTERPSPGQRNEPTSDLGAPCQKTVEPAARPLALALNAFLDNRPEEALQHLKAYGAKDQELVMLLLPILAEVERGGVTCSPRKETVQAVLNSLRSADQELRVHAPLEMEKLSYCLDIEAFGVVQKRADNKFRAGDYVYVYAELQNLVDRRGADGRYAVRLSSGLEIRATDGRAAHRFQPIANEPLHSWSPRTDYFTRVGFQLPANLAPGLYSLRVRVTDLDTGRTVEEGLPLHILPGTASAAHR